MFRRMLVTLMLIATLVLMTVAGASAMEMKVAPGGGSAFGDHVSSKAPEHPIRCGPMFGACVSGMARGECPHGN